jgi:hypothetical protein
MAALCWRHGLQVPNITNGRHSPRPQPAVSNISDALRGVPRILLGNHKALVAVAAADLIAFSLFYRSNHHPIRNFGV